MSRLKSVVSNTERLELFPMSKAERRRVIGIYWYLHGKLRKPGDSTTYGFSGQFDTQADALRAIQTMLAENANYKVEFALNERPLFD